MADFVYTYTDLGYTSNGFKFGLVTATGGALTGGAESATIGEMSQILQAMGSCYDPMQTAAYIYEDNFTFATNVLTHTQKTAEVATGTWANSTDATGGLYKALVWGW